MLNGAGSGLSAKEAAALLGEGAINAGNEQALAEDEKMENVGHTYDVFIQNEIPHTSHSIEWLPISHPDPDNPTFEFNYFLLGTHVGEPEDENEQVQTHDELQLSRVRTPLKQMVKDEIYGLQKF